MTIAIVGLWHLGLVTAACVAEAGYDVCAFDECLETIENLQRGVSPIFEPGLDALIQKNVGLGRLNFTATPSAIATAEFIWVTYDTPVDAQDVADVDSVMARICALFPVIRSDSIVLISSQLPVGSTALLQNMFQAQFPERAVRFAYSPENLRLGKAIDVFTHPDRIVVGVDSEVDQQRLQMFLEKISSNLCWMSIASAEMTKHALNAFLATSVVFINELATICEHVGADAAEVERGLKSEIRIGSKAYLKPGSAFAGGTLARDVTYLKNIAQQKQLPAQLWPAILHSNEQHKQWAIYRLNNVLGDLNGKRIAILGLTYKPGTDTLRRSAAIENCLTLSQAGAVVVAYDPEIQRLPEALATSIHLAASASEAMRDADAIVLCTEWPIFKSLVLEDFLMAKYPRVFDLGGFLSPLLKNQPQIHYFTVGKAHEIV